MNPQERQIIDSLFDRLQGGAAKAPPRDPEAEALIQQRMQSLPGAPYHMAQAMVVQERALQQAQERLAAYEQGRPGSFAGPQQYGQPAGYAAPAYPQQAPGGGVGGFLGGAAKMALGIGGGILVANAAMSIAQDIFGSHDAAQQALGGQDDGGQGQNDGAQDDGGGQVQEVAYQGDPQQSSFLDDGASTFGSFGGDQDEFGSGVDDGGGFDDFGGGGDDFGGGDDGSGW